MTGRGIPTNHRINPRPINTLLFGNLSFENVRARLWFRNALKVLASSADAAPRPAQAKKRRRAPPGKVSTPPSRSNVAGTKNASIRPHAAGGRLLRQEGRANPSARATGDLTTTTIASDQGRRRPQLARTTPATGAGNVPTTSLHRVPCAPGSRLRARGLRLPAPDAGRCLSADRHRWRPAQAPAAAPRPDLDRLPPRWAASARTAMR